MALTVFSSLTFAGLEKRHHAGTITDGTFPGNYTFNGASDITNVIKVYL